MNNEFKLWTTISLSRKRSMRKHFISYNEAPISFNEVIDKYDGLYRKKGEEWYIIWKVQVNKMDVR